MDRKVRFGALTGLAIALGSACGDPLFMVGDAPGIVRIVAGVPGVVGAEIGALATESLLSTPTGVAVGGDGVLYIADNGSARILAVTPTDTMSVLLDHRGVVDPLRVRRPEGLALQGDAALIIADPAGHLVWRLELGSGSAVPIAGTGVPGSAPDTAPARQAALNAPTGAAVAPDGRVYFSELGGHRVRRIEGDGTLVTVAGTGEGGFAGDGGPAASARLSQPAGLAIDGDQLYIADSGNNRIRVVDLGTGVIRTIAGQGIAGFDGDGGPALSAKLDRPRAVAVSADRTRLFVADTDNHRVRIVNLTSNAIATFAGTGNSAFNGDLLQANATSLNAPRGLALTPIGLLFISDSDNHIIRRTPVQFLVR